MLTAVALSLVIFASLLQVTWVNNWAIGGIVPNVLLVLLVVITIRSGKRTGLIWAFVGGLLVTVMSVYPFSGYLIGLLIAVIIVGFLSESVFGNVTPVTLMGQVVIATVSFSLVRAGGAELAAVFWSTPVAVIWQTEILHMLWQILYNIALAWLIYFAFDWIEQKLAMFHRRPGLKKQRLL